MPLPTTPPALSSSLLHIDDRLLYWDGLASEVVRLTCACFSFSTLWL